MTFTTLPHSCGLGRETIPTLIGAHLIGNCGPIHFAIGFHTNSLPIAFDKRECSTIEFAFNHRD
jgi:hypothetical protein